ncbi:MAG: hypothetical protein SGARI_001121, partial [Bacillariaceae sp.]
MTPTRRRNSNHVISSSNSRHSRQGLSKLFSSSFDYEGDDDEDDDDDEYIEIDSLGDWRNFRRSLTLGVAEDEQETSSSSDGSVTRVSLKDNGDDSNSNKNSNASKPKTKTAKIKSVSKDNEEVLLSQNENLAEEYMTGPEIGGLVVRMPLEVELFRNYRHSIIGNKLKKLLDQEGIPPKDMEISTWYARSKRLIEQEMVTIAASADDEGQIDATTLKEEASEMLSLYLDNQETWQEVCLVAEKEDGNAKTLVLNRPMAFQLTENLGKLVLLGAFQTTNQPKINESRKDLAKFMRAFGKECAVYVGGPDDQGLPAMLIHGINDLPGAVEISPGTHIYQGGIDAAVQGVIDGKYNPLEFRFF